METPGKRSLRMGDEGGWGDLLQSRMGVLQGINVVIEHTAGSKQGKQAIGNCRKVRTLC